MIYLQVTVYTTTTCPFCSMLKKYLQEKGVAFTEKLVDQDDAAQKEMTEVSGGFMGVPFTVVTDEAGSKQSVIGFDKGKINQVLGLN